jgi:uncharacterized protein
MKIPFASLSEGKHSYSFKEPPETLGLDSQYSEIAVQVQAEKTPTEVFVTTSAISHRQCVCDRCLTEFVLPIESTIVMHYVTDENDAAAYDPAETQVVEPGLPAIELTDDVRQGLEMAVPLKLLCDEGCEGLCQQCGKNLNEGPCSCEPIRLDPRWEALEKLKNQDAETDNEK